MGGAFPHYLLQRRGRQRRIVDAARDLVHDCFLDAVADAVMTARAGNTFILNPKFASLLTPPQHQIRMRLGAALDDLYNDPEVVESPSWVAVLRSLKEAFGLEEEANGIGKVKPGFRYYASTGESIRPAGCAVSRFGAGMSSDVKDAAEHQPGLPSRLPPLSAEYANGSVAKPPIAELPVSSVNRPARVIL